MNDWRREFNRRVLTYVGGGFGIVAALAWNEAIKELIQYLFPLSKDTLLAKFAYALVLTAAVVAVIRYLEAFRGGVESGGQTE